MAERHLFYRRFFKMLVFVSLSLFSHFLILWPGSAAADNRQGLTAYLDRDSANVGQMVTLTLKYVLPEKARLPEDAEIKGLEGLTIVARQKGPGEIRIKLLVDRLGPWKTGPISLEYIDNEGKIRNLTAQPVSLTILSNLGEKPAEARLRPIEGIIPTKSIWLRYLPWAAGVLVVSAVALVLFRRYRRGRRAGTSIVSQVPPHIRAQKEIEELEAMQLFENGNFKAFYFGLSQILRRYLESVRGFPAAEYTTEEIAWCMDNEQDRNILPLFRHADLVKFSDSIPTFKKKEADVKEALAYIRETSPSPAREYPEDRSGRGTS